MVSENTFFFRVRKSRFSSLGTGALLKVGFMVIIGFAEAVVVDGGG
jgi:hypothetical protein